MWFLITAGGTREYIDPVRFISNASSGRMGYALAHAALKADHRVTLITTVNRASCIVNRATSDEQRVTVIEVETAAEMFKAVKKHFPRCDCLLMAAAVADYTPIRPAKTKIKRTGKGLTVKLKPTVDILKWAGKHKRLRRQRTDDRRQKAEDRRQKTEDRGQRTEGGRHGEQIVVGFALEDRNVRARAEEKLKEKKLDMIIANTPAAIGADKSTVQIKIYGRKWLRLAHATKATIARRIIREAESLLE
jgi:phosphopantothenoylcysteine decarboxylase/phosphopantothenate--cysteine ligase